MKTKQRKREEALERARHYTWENSRAKRLGTKTREEWEKAWREAAAITA